ncbi:MAG: hypothetical protein KGL53_02065 [Elusimicrobia bacterium]|nr:hypothetical protein [Elusimicrobiota bacterium]
MTQAAIFLALGLFILWTFGWETVGQRLRIQAVGEIVTSRDVPAKGAPRYATQYTLREPDETVTEFWSGATDASLARSMPVGTKVDKQRWRLDYKMDGRLVAFPIIFYAIVLGIGFCLAALGLTLLLRGQSAPTS